MSTLKVNAIRQTAASSDAITLASDGSCTVKATNNLSNRNFIINGAMQFAQRGSSFTATGDEYTLDRWRHSHGSSFNFDTTTTQESSGPDGFGNSLKITPDSVVTPSGGENGIIEQYIEGQNLQGLAFGTSSAKSVTVSFYAKSAASNANDQYTVWVQMYNSAGNRFIKNKAFTVTASWQRFSITFTGNTSENIINTNAIGLRLGLILSSGPDDIAAEKTSWEDSNFWTSVTGQSNFMDNTSNEFHLSGVQVEAGDVATDFEHRSYSDELARCQRYYYLLASGNTQFMCMGDFWTADQADAGIQYPVEMRATPTLDHTNGADYYIVWTNSTSSYIDGTVNLWNRSTNKAATWYATADTSRTAGHACRWTTSNGSAHFAFTAEL